MVNSHQLHMLQNHETHWVTLYKIILMSTVMHALLGMYKLLVRPHPECAALVWNPHLIRNISKLENAWMFALRQNYLWIRLFPTQCFIPQPSRVLYNHPSYINLLPTPIIAFVPSTISIWNTLPHVALTATSITTFRSHVVPFFL